MGNRYKFPLIQRIKIAWVAFRKPHVASSALTINKALINKEASATLSIRDKDGKTSNIEYTITKID